MTPFPGTPQSRLGVVGILLGLLFGLCIWYGSLAPAPQMGDYPGNEELASGFDQYVGQRVAVSGVVQSRQPTTITVTAGPESFDIRIKNAPSEVATGDFLRVFGIVQSGHTVRVTNAVVVSQRGLWYTWLISFLASLWIAGRVVRYWRLDTEQWVLKPRDSPLTAIRLRNWWRKTDDA